MTDEAAPAILHMLTPLKHMSPFDVNMAADAGFSIISTYQGVALGEVAPLTQDAFFSRSPQNGTRTGIFFAGKSAETALDMMDAAKAAFVPPFQLHLFADPAGSFTTGAAMVAKAEACFRAATRADLAGRAVVVFGGTGVVAYGAAALVALLGARARLVGYDGVERVGQIARSMQSRFSASVEAADGSNPQARLAAISDADVILSAGPAGARILSLADLKTAKRLKIVADVNAVPPFGVEGIDAFADGAPIGVRNEAGEALGIGALAIGDVKYRTQSGLFRDMLQAKAPLTIDFRAAFEKARAIVAKR